MVLIRIAVILWLVLIALCGSAAVYGRFYGSPSLLQTLNFAVCGQKPCFWGIAPGIAPWKDAEAILLQHGGQTETNMTIQIPVNNSIVSVGASDNFQLVSHISFYPTNDSKLPSLAHFIQTYGTPCAVLRSSRTKQMWILYNFLTLEVELDSDHLRMNLPVKDALLTEPSLTPGILSTWAMYACIDSNSSPFPFTPWLGFASIDYYKAHGLP